MSDYYLNKREPGHEFELIVRGVVKDVDVHTYFHTFIGALRNVSLLTDGVQWTLVDLIHGKPISDSQPDTDHGES